MVGDGEAGWSVEAGEDGGSLMSLMGSKGNEP